MGLSGVQNRVCLGGGGLGGVGGFLPIIRSLPTHVEAELGCDRNKKFNSGILNFVWCIKNMAKIHNP